MDLRDIATETRELWIAARDAGNPNHSTIRAIASICAEIADDRDEAELPEALRLLDEARELADALLDA